MTALVLARKAEHGQCMANLQTSGVPIRAKGYRVAAIYLSVPMALVHGSLAHGDSARTLEEPGESRSMILSSTKLFDVRAPYVSFYITFLNRPNSAVFAHRASTNLYFVSSFLSLPFGYLTSNLFCARISLAHCDSYPILQPQIKCHHLPIDKLQLCLNNLLSAHTLIL